MKKLALFFVMGILCLLSFRLSAQSITLSAELDKNFAPSNSAFTILHEGFKELDYLDIISDRSGFNKTIIGYRKSSPFSFSFDLAKDGHEQIEIVLKDFDGTALWDKIALRTDKNFEGTARLGDYIDQAVDLGDGWLRVAVPFEVFTQDAFKDIRHLQFPYSLDAGTFHLGIREIVFTGGSVPSVWFGESKYDNALGGISGANSDLIGSIVTKGGDREIIQTRIDLIEVGRTKTGDEMPYVLNEILPAGNHQGIGVVVDDLGNEYSDTVNLSISKGFTYTKEDVSCYGAADGSISVVMDGGTPPYTITWSNGATDFNLTNLGPGGYTAELTDSDGADVSTTILINEPTQLGAVFNISSCDSDSIEVTLSGGEAPYSASSEDGPLSVLSGVGEQWSYKTHVNAPSSSYDIYNYNEDIAVDSKNNTFIVGFYSDSAYIGNQVIASSPGRNMFFVKLSEVGEVLWSYDITNVSLSYDHIPRIYTESNGDVVLTIFHGGDLNDKDATILPVGPKVVRFSESGEFLDIVGFTPNTEEAVVTSAGDIYILKNSRFETFITLEKWSFDSEILWVSNFFGTNIRLSNITAHDEHGIAIVGLYRRSIEFDDIRLVNDGNDYLFVAKLDKNGDVLWANHVGSNVSGSRMRQFAYLSFDNFGNVIMSSANATKNVFYGDFSVGRSALTLSKMNAENGSFQWVLPYMRLGFSGTSHLKVDNKNDIFVSGLSYENDLLYGLPGFVGPYLIKVNSDGLPLSLNKNIFGPGYVFDSGTPFGLSNDGYIIKQGAEFHKVGPQPKFRVPLDAEYITIQDKNGCEETKLIELKTLDTPVICGVFTDDDQNNRITWSNTSTGYNIYTEGIAIGDYQLLGTSHPGESEFIDPSADTRRRSYRYKIAAVDSCGNESELSAAHKTLHLTINEGNLGQVNLIWDKYEGIEYRSSIIYRGESPETMEVLDVIPGDFYTFSDFEATPGALYYMIELADYDLCSVDGSSSGRTSRMASNEDNATRIKSNVAYRYGEAGNLQIYPNPAREQFTIRFDPDGTEYELSIMDMKGRKYRSMKGVTREAQIAVSDLDAGMYIVVLKNDTGGFLRKTLSLY